MLSPSATGSLQRLLLVNPVVPQQVFYYFSDRRFLCPRTDPLSAVNSPIRFCRSCLATLILSECVFSRTHGRSLGTESKRSAPRASSWFAIPVFWLENSARSAFSPYTGPLRCLVLPVFALPCFLLCCANGRAYKSHPGNSRVSIGCGPERTFKRLPLLRVNRSRSNHHKHPTA